MANMITQASRGRNHFVWDGTVTVLSWYNGQCMWMGKSSSGVDRENLF